MPTINTTDNAALIRTQAWNDELEVRFDDENFMMTKFAEWIDGVEGSDTTITIPGVGEVQMTDYAEGDTIPAYGLTDSFFTFKPDQEKAGSIAITKKMLRNSYYMTQVVPFIAKEQTRKCYEIIEEFMFNLSQQLPYTVDGVQHRLEGSGTNKALTLGDFSKAKSVIRKSSNLVSNYIGFVNPDQASEIEQTIGITSPANAKFEPVAEEGLLDQTGTSFLYNIYGVDIYVTNFLANGIDNTASGGSDNSALNAVIVFSITDMKKLPFIAAWVERPNFDLYEEKRTRTDYHICHMAFGGKLHHPVNLVVIECL